MDEAGDKKIETNSVKEIEVTAKEIVDRISNIALEEKNPANHVKRKSSRGGSGSSNISGDGQVSTAEQKGIEQLLNAVEKWVQEMQAVVERPGSREGEKCPENLHWVYSIESYLRSIDTDWSSQKVLTHKISSQLLLWLKQLFHFRNPANETESEFNSVHPHWDIGGMFAVIQLSLHLKFPRLLSSGYQNFQDEAKSPIIYCSDEVIGHQACSKLGLPFSCVGFIDHKDDKWVELFEQKVAVDKANGLVPIALLLNTNVQYLSKAIKAGESHGIWVHIYGPNVLAYMIRRPESNEIGHSFTIDLTRWLKSPKLPYLTIYKQPENVDLSLMELCDLGLPRIQIMCFTIWFVAHVFGRHQLTTLVNDAIHRGKFLLDMVRRHECLHTVPSWSRLSDGNVVLSTLTFQFKPATYKDDTDSTETIEPTSQYIDTLNSWLFHIMERDLKAILPLEFVFVDGIGWNIHVDIIRCKRHTLDDEGAIVSVFDNHMKVLTATVSQKIKFRKLVREAEELEWVNHESQWAGLGAVRYIPVIHRSSSRSSTPQQQSPQQNDVGEVEKPPQQQKKLSRHLSANTAAIATMRENVDHLNASIVDKLKAIDTAFSLGETSSGEWCVQFGMVTEETDVQELVRLVISTGQEIEESSEFFNRMSELVKKGIEKATEELKKEREEALWEEGILRQVPVVGTFVNWLSPPTKESGIRGRALNLTQGKVESTENIYKYHMQVVAPMPPHSASSITTSANSTTTNSPNNTTATVNSK